MGDLDGNLSDDSDLDGNVSDDEDFIDDLDRAFDAESEYDDLDVINIYQDNQDELAEVVRHIVMIDHQQLIYMVSLKIGE